MDRDVKRPVLTLVVLLIGSSVTLAGSDTITTGSLFEEMVDLKALATFPSPAYRTIQFSSYDRRSTLPGGPDWFANSDGFGREPIPNFEKVLREPDDKGVGEYLVADVAGPGAIVRLWTAAIAGQIRMFIDDANEPVFDGSANDFFHRPYDHFEQTKQLDTDRFRRTVYQRDASYAPIPFAKRLRVVWTGNIQEIHFYELQVRLYDKGASVVSFRPEDIAQCRETIDKVTQALDDPDQHVSPRAKRYDQRFEASLDPAEAKTILEMEGSRAIGRLNLQLVAKDMDMAQRQTVLQITFDGYPWPQVQSPVGDFFGAAPGINPYTSLPFTVQPDGTMVCRFVMPFARSCKIALWNGGSQPVSARGSVVTSPHDWTDATMHFRARWRVDHDLIASNRDVQDLPFVLAHGRGVYVGTGVYLMNPSSVPTPYGNWWGEGDEKIFVDDDKRPSTFGTGSEDYFNYSWSSPDIFLFPYCGQPRNDGPGNRGFVTNYRWHMLDALPFSDNIRFYMELFSHERTPGMSYARIGYHYGRPGMTDDFQPIKPADLEMPLPPERWQPAARMGAANSVFFAAEDIMADTPGTQFDERRLWAGGKLLLWNPKKKGEKKSFTIPIKSAGKKQINMVLAMTPQSGKIAASLDGEPVKLSGRDTIDLHRPYRILSRRFALPTSELSAGDHTLTLELKGTSEGVRNPEIGIDFIYVQNR